MLSARLDNNETNNNNIFNKVTTITVLLKKLC